MPVARLSAPAPIDAVTSALAPGASVPATGERSSQALVLPAVQVRALVAMFVSVKNIAPGTKGPPSGPAATMLSIGCTRRASGRSKDSVTPIVVVLEGDCALTPMPRLAKAAH